jgi:hypothetical protein
LLLLLLLPQRPLLMLLLLLLLLLRLLLLLLPPFATPTPTRSPSVDSQDLYRLHNDRVHACHSAIQAP